MNLSYALPMLLFTANALAQNVQGMSGQDMQSMMQKMQEMQSCIANIDQAELKALEQRSEKMEAEVKDLCSAGKRDEAQQKAMDFGREVSDSPAVQTMKKCTAGLEGMMPDIGVGDILEELKDKHVCDN
jgi:hypothetical protein